MTRGRGNNTNTKISVAGTLSVTGSIHVTWAGTQPKLGEEVTLWTASRFSAASTVELNLPTLPTGLYWDTSDLLKPTGILRVTDQAPTGIETLNTECGTLGDDHYYTLDGIRISVPSASSVKSVLPKGIYIRNGKKVIIK